MILYRVAWFYDYDACKRTFYATPWARISQRIPHYSTILAWAQLIIKFSMVLPSKILVTRCLGSIDSLYTTKLYIITRFLFHCILTSNYRLVCSDNFRINESYYSLALSCCGSSKSWSCTLSITSIHDSLTSNGRPICSNKI